MRLKLGFLIAVLTVLALARGADADCCNFMNHAVGPDACNVFGCNCAGPCSNYGNSCANGPITMDGVIGHCPGYEVCDDGGFCQPGSTCFNAGGKSYCEPKSLAGARPHTTPARVPIAVNRAAQRPSASERFQSVDADKSNRISFDEVKSWARKNGSTLSDDELKRKFDEVDKDHDGTLVRDEFDKPAPKPAAKHK